MPPFPSWGELLASGAERLAGEGKETDAALVNAFLGIDEPRYLDAAQHLREHLPDWAGFLKSSIDLPSEDADDASLALARAAWKLGSPLIVTTNYDRVLEWTCPALRDLDTWDVEAPAEQAEMLRHGRVPAPTVWHLHGRIRNAARLILTPGGYARLYPSQASRPRHEAALATLRHLLTARTFLFLGFSFADEHFGGELREVWELFEGHAGPHYALVHRADAARLRRAGVPVELVEFEDFGALVELVEALAVEAPAAVEPQEADEPEEGWDVFLAAVSDSLQSKRRELEDALVDRGFHLAPRLPPPHGARKHREAAVAALGSSRLSVHLLDGLAGGEIHDDPAATYPREQVRLAREHAPAQLVWVPRGVVCDDPEQLRFLEQLGTTASTAGARAISSRRSSTSSGRPPSSPRRAAPRRGFRPGSCSTPTRTTRRSFGP